MNIVCTAEVEIGLESTQYSVEEDEGYVEVCVVMSGELADGVELEVILETASGSANGEAGWRHLLVTMLNSFLSLSQHWRTMIQWISR